MRFNLILSILALVVLSACTSTKNSEVSTDLLQGNWELKKEVANKLTLDCSDDLVKTILSIQVNNYFIVYDDLEKSLLGKGVANMQKQYTGQYKVDGNELVMTYEIDGNNYDDTFEIKKCTEKELILANAKNKRTFHYVRQ